ncbi:MAG: class I tRNA ligase family protein, partial [Janthinobacterium lividum]
GPPEEDIDWADVSPAGSLKFLQRAYRLATDVTSAPGTDPAGGDVGLRRETHRLLADVTAALETQRFNVAVARVMEMVNAGRRAIDSGAGPADPAVREAAEVVTVALSVVAPYAAEEMWAKLGHAPSVAHAAWPQADSSLLVAETVTCVFQVQGKVRGRIEVAPDVTEDVLREAALADEGVLRALAGREVAKVIVRAPKLVSIVPGRQDVSPGATGPRPEPGDAP